MTYTQPAVTMLGRAIDMVQFGGSQKNPAGGPDSCMSPGGLCPAYEVDE